MTMDSLRDASLADLRGDDSALATGIARAAAEAAEPVEVSASFSSADPTLLPPGADADTVLAAAIDRVIAEAAEPVEIAAAWSSAEI